MDEPPSSGPALAAETEDPESTVSLLARVRTGDEVARNRLCGRYRSLLRRWAHGRLPLHARGVAESEDVVQLALVRALTGLDEFEPRGEGAFLAYLRTIAARVIIDMIRGAKRRPAVQCNEPPELAYRGPSPIDALIDQERLEAWDRALEALQPVQREAVILRIEMGFDYRRIAEAIGTPSANAARMIVRRALIRLTELMDA